MYKILNFKDFFKNTKKLTVKLLSSDEIRKQIKKGK